MSDRESVCEWVQAQNGVTLTLWVPKIMPSGRGNMQHRVKCLNLTLKRIFQGYIFFRKYMRSIALLNLKDGKEEIIYAFWRWTLLQNGPDWSTNIPLFSMPSVLCPALPKLEGKNLGSLTCSFFICYHVNIRLIIPLQSPKKRNIWDWKGINKISKWDRIRVNPRRKLNIAF